MGKRAVLGWLTGILLAVGCAQPVVEATGSGESNVTADGFNKNSVLTDEELRDVNALSASQIQDFLDKTPWGHASVLAAYKDNGKSAASIIHDVCVKNGINPLALLTRLQMEQSLIYKKTAPEKTLSLAFGCGCPHSPLCSPAYEGFENQAECAARTLSKSVDRATTDKGTASGWKKGVAKKTEDGISITPENAATAALYTYTPWVGEFGGGRKGVGGAGLHYQVWERFAEALGYEPGGGGTSKPPSGSGSGTNNDGSSGSSTTKPSDPPKPADPPKPSEPTPTDPPKPSDPAPTPTPTPTDPPKPADPPPTDPPKPADPPPTPYEPPSSPPKTTTPAPTPPTSSPGGSSGSNPIKDDEDDALSASSTPTPASEIPPSSSTSEDSSESEGDNPAPKKGKKKPVSSSGCNATGSSSSSTSLLPILLAGSLLAARRRRDRRS